MLQCYGDFQTIYRENYKPHSSVPKGLKPVKATKPAQTDETLITGYFRNNIQINGVPKKSKTWTKSTFGVEEYKDFLKRLECCKKEVFKLYFSCPEVNLDLLDLMLKDLEKSIYQVVYSPNEYVPRKETRRLYNTSSETANMMYHPTTYRTYYSRIGELIRYKNALYGILNKEDKEKLKNDLRKIYRTGISTYYDNICIPAIEAAKTKKTHDAPIDRYTLRKI